MISKVNNMLKRIQFKDTINQQITLTKTKKNTRYVLGSKYCITHQPSHPHLLLFLLPNNKHK